VVSVWDTVNHKWIKGGADGIPAGISPIEPAINFKTHRLYIGSIHTNSVTVIDTQTMAVVKTIETSAEPYGTAVDTLNNRVYIGHLDSRATTAPTVGCPTCPDSVRAFKAVVDVIDAKDNTIWDTFYAGSFTRNVKVDPNTGRAYVANLNTHSLTLVQGKRVVGELQVGFGPRGVALNPVTHKIYVGNTAQSTGQVDLPDGVPDSITVIHDIPGIRLAVSPEKAKAKKRTCFTFRARNSYSTRVLSGASISFAGSKRKTNKSGRAEFCERPGAAGKLSARVTKKDYETGKTSVRVGR
jgi:YVTN family beta-propeller protein